MVFLSARIPVNIKKIKHDRVTQEKTHLMYSLIRLKMLASCVLLCLAFLPRAQAAPDVVPPPDGCYFNFTTAEGCLALQSLTSGAANTGLGWRALFSDTTGAFNTAVGTATLLSNTNGSANTATGGLALLLNTTGVRNTANGAAALFSNSTGENNGAFGTGALADNTDGFSNNAVGDSALFRNVSGALNTAVGDEALLNNDANGTADANYNTAVGGLAMINNVTGDGNTVVGEEAGQNIVAGFNNTYIGQLVGSGADDEESTIRIADVSGGNSQQCYIGGIFNNEQPVGGDVVFVTLDLLNDHLGWTAPAGAKPAVPQRPVPQPRGRPQPARQTMLNDKVEKLQATVTQQQKQIETLTAQLREQADQIQKVSAQLEMVRSAPRVVENR